MEIGELMRVELPRLGSDCKDRCNEYRMKVVQVAQVGDIVVGLSVPLVSRLC